MLGLMYGCMLGVLGLVAVVKGETIAASVFVTGMITIFAVTK